MAKHYHTVKLKHKIKWNAPFKERIFSCMDSECFWYTAAENLLGKKLQCPTCRNLYIADREALMRKVPHCKECTRGAQVKEVIDDVEERLKKLFGGD